MLRDRPLQRRKPEHASTYLRNQHPITLLHAWLYPLAIPIQSTRADSKNLGLVELFDGALGQEDTGAGLCLGLDALNKDAVEKGGNGANRLESGGLQSTLAGGVVTCRGDGSKRCGGAKGLTLGLEVGLAGEGGLAIADSFTEDLRR